MSGVSAVNKEVWTGYEGQETCNIVYMYIMKIRALRPNNMRKVVANYGWKWCDCI